MNVHDICIATPQKCSRFSYFSYHHFVSQRVALSIHAQTHAQTEKETSEGPLPSKQRNSSPAKMKSTLDHSEETPSLPPEMNPSLPDLPDLPPQTALRRSASMAATETKLMKRMQKSGKSSSDLLAAAAAEEIQIATRDAQRIELMSAQIKKLKELLNAKSKRIQEVTDHHQRMLRASLAASRVERKEAVERAVKEALQSLSSVPVLPQKYDDHGSPSDPIFRLQRKNRSTSVTVRTSKSASHKSRESVTFIDVARKKVVRRSIHGTSSHSSMASRDKEATWEMEPVKTGIAVVSPQGRIDIEYGVERLMEWANGQIEIMKQLDNAKLVVSLAPGMKKLLDASATFHANIARILLLHTAKECDADMPELCYKSLHYISTVCDARDELKKAIVYAERAAKVCKRTTKKNKDQVWVKLKMRTLLMCMENQDLDRAEVIAMQVANVSDDDLQKQKSIATRHLAVIRSAMKYDQLVSVDRQSGKVEIVVDGKVRKS